MPWWVKLQMTPAMCKASIWTFHQKHWFKKCVNLNLNSTSATKNQTAYAKSTTVGHSWPVQTRLTGLPNKLSFLQAIVPQEMQQAQHGNHPMGFMLISGDNLGPINEQYGRDAGDRIIKTLAKALQSELKGEEQLGHLDGSNFAVSLYPATLEDTKKRAEELCAYVASQSFQLDQTQLHITASIGIMALNSETINDTRQATENTFNTLNQALFKAKRAGGNRVESV